MSSWMIELEGDKFDIQDLQNLNFLPNIKVVEEYERYYISANEFDSCAEAREVLLQGTNLVNVINGIAQLQNSNWKPVKLIGVARNEIDGSRTQFLSPEPIQGRSKVSANLTVIRADGTVNTSRQPSFIESVFTISTRNANVERALRIYGSREHNWVNLYIIYEIVESDVGGKNVIGANGWCSETQIRNFKHTANSVGAVGDESRHGKESTAPPSIPMPLEEARILIVSLLKQWIRSK